MSDGLCDFRWIGQNTPDNTYTYDAKPQEAAATPLAITRLAFTVQLKTQSELAIVELFIPIHH